MKKIVVTWVIMMIMMIGSFIGGAYAGGEYWVEKVIDIQEESWCEMALGEERKHYVYNDAGNTCLGEFVMTRTK